MRLIDGNELKKTFEAWRERLMQKAEMKLDVMNVWATERQIELIDAAIDELERMPEIREEPARRGYWEKSPTGNPNFNYCSVCDGAIQRYDNVTFTYCPHCGARMGGHKPQSAPKHRTHTLYTHSAGRFHEIEADGPEFLPEFYGWDANGG